MTSPIHVFVTYAWEDDRYKAFVEQFAAQLRHDGVDVHLDVWQPNGRPIVNFMNFEVREARKVLMLCSPSYREKVHAMEKGAAVSGSGWESALVSAAMFNEDPSDKVVPILTLGEWKDAAPSWVQGLPYYDFRTRSRKEYRKILRRLVGDTAAASLKKTPSDPAHLVRALFDGREFRARPPDEVPPLPDPLVERMEVEELQKAVSTNSAVAICGMPGVGKSLLAQQYVCNGGALARFPDGRLWVSCGPDRRRSEALQIAIDSFVRAGHRRVDLAESEGRLRGLLLEKKCLIVLDDVWHWEVIHAMRKCLSPGCVVLITTRDKSVARDCSIVLLAPFTPQQSEIYLVASGARPTPEALAVASVVGHLPIALAAVSAAAAATSDPDIWRQLLHRIQSRRAALSSLGSAFQAFQVSEEALPPKQRERYRTLAVFPHPAKIPEEVLIDYWKVDPAEASTTIALLHDRHMLRAQAGHVALHEMQQRWLCSKRTDLRNLHYRLVASLPTVSNYRLRFAAYHLIQACRRDECTKLLCSADWWMAKLDNGLLTSVVSDLSLAAHEKLEMSDISRALLNMLTQRQKVPWPELSRALRDTFGTYEQWPRELREELEGDPRRQIRIFLGMTFDKEGAYDSASNCYLQLLDHADENVRFDGVIRLAEVRRHQGRQEEALRLLEHHWQLAGGSVAEESGRWLQYHLAVSFIECGWHYKAREVLKGSGQSERLRDAVNHQLAVIQLELLHVPLGHADKSALESAMTTLNTCLAEREARGDFRSFQDRRRLGQALALSGDFAGADRAFRVAQSEAERWGNRRYSQEVSRDRDAFVTTAQKIIESGTSGLEVVQLAELRAAPVSSARGDTVLRDAFRVAAARGFTYLPLIEATTGHLLTSCARWEFVHGLSDGLRWHPTVTVLLFSEDVRRLALQRRREPGSSGKLDASVTGHQEVGSTDVDTALREAREDLALGLGRGQLRRLGGPYSFSKIGGPTFSAGVHKSAHEFEYKKNCWNRERTSVFIAILTNEQMKCLEQKVEWRTVQELRDLTARPPAAECCASGLRQILHPEIIDEIEEVLARAADRMGIEFFVTGPPRSGKAAFARRLLELYGGSCIDLAIFGRFFAWWALTSSKIHGDEAGNNSQRYVWAAAARELAVDADGRIRFRGKDVTEENRGEFSIYLESLMRELRIEPDGSVFFRGHDLTAEMESSDVTEQAERQAASTYAHRASLNRIIWDRVDDLKTKGPVFLLGNERSSARSAVRGIYLDSTPRARAAQQSPPGARTLEEAEEHLRRLDSYGRTDLQRLRCDAVLDTSSMRSPEDATAALGLAYERARLAARMDFFGLRARCVVPRIEGRDLLLKGGPALLAAADLDHYCRFGQAHGHRLDLLAYFESLLGQIVQSHGGQLIAWGSDETVLFLPLVNEKKRASHLLDCIRCEYQAMSHYRLGIGKLRNYGALSRFGQATLDSAFGPFVDRWAGEDLFAFEIGAYDGLDVACERQLRLINAHVPAGEVRLEASQGWVVPVSTASFAGILVDGRQDEASLDNALDLAFRTLSNLKREGKRNFYALCKATPPLIMPVLQLGNLPEMRRALGEASPVRRAERRNEYPFVLRMGAFERFLCGWLREDRDGRKSLLCIMPRYHERGSTNGLEDGRKRFEFESIGALFDRRDRDLLVAASAHHTRECIQGWAKSNGLRIGAYRGRALEGLKPPLQTFWGFEGWVDETQLFDLLLQIHSRLTQVTPEVDVRVLGKSVALEGQTDGAELLRNLAELMSDARACTIAGQVAILPGPPQDLAHSDVAAVEEKEQRLAMDCLFGRERELAPWGHRFAPIQVEVVRRLRHADEGHISGGDPRELAIIAALEAVQAWPTRTKLLAGIGETPAAKGFRELAALLPSDAPPAYRAHTGRVFGDLLQRRVRDYVLRHGVPFLCPTPLLLDGPVTGRIGVDRSANRRTSR